MSHRDPYGMQIPYGATPPYLLRGAPLASDRSTRQSRNATATPENVDDSSPRLSPTRRILKDGSAIWVLESLQPSSPPLLNPPLSAGLTCRASMEDAKQMLAASGRHSDDCAPTLRQAELVESSKSLLSSSIAGLSASSSLQSPNITRGRSSASGLLSLLFPSKSSAAQPGRRFAKRISKHSTGSAFNSNASCCSGCGCALPAAAHNDQSQAMIDKYTGSTDGTSSKSIADARSPIQSWASAFALSSCASQRTAASDPHALQLAAAQQPNHHQLLTPALTAVSTARSIGSEATTVSEPLDSAPDDYIGFQPPAAYGPVSHDHDDNDDRYGDGCDGDLRAGAIELPPPPPPSQPPSPPPEPEDDEASSSSAAPSPRSRLLQLSHNLPYSPPLPASPPPLPSTSKMPPRSAGTTPPLASLSHPAPQAADHAPPGALCTDCVSRLRGLQLAAAATGIAKQAQMSRQHALSPGSSSASSPASSPAPNQKQHGLNHPRASAERKLLLLQERYESMVPRHVLSHRINAHLDVCDQVATEAGPWMQRSVWRRFDLGW